MSLINQGKIMASIDEEKEKRFFEKKSFANLTLCFYETNKILKRFETCPTPSPLTDFNIKTAQKAINKENIDNKELNKMIKMSKIGNNSLFNTKLIMS